MRPDPAAEPRLIPSGTLQAPRVLDAAEKHQNDDDEQNQPHSPGRGITPLPAMGPPRQYTQECHHQKHDQYRSEHCFLLFPGAGQDRPGTTSVGALQKKSRYFRVPVPDYIVVIALDEPLVRVDADCDSNAGMAPVVQVISTIGVGDIHVIIVVPVVRPGFRPRVHETEPKTVILETGIPANN
jgi:hypothetical protein